MLRALASLVSPGTALALAVVILTIAGRSSRTARVLALCAALALAFLRVHSFPLIPGKTHQIDLEIYRAAGHAVRSGTDPYASEKLVNPPTALPLFAAMAAVPATWMRPAWAVLNIVGGLALVPLSRWALWPRKEDRQALAPIELVPLALVLGCSDAAVTHHLLGQLSVFLSLVLLTGLALRNRGRDAASGLAWSVTSMKPTTLLPFLIVWFRRPVGLRAPAALALGIAVLSLGAARPELLAERYGASLRNIERLAQPGMVNDYTFDGPENANIVGLNHALYRVGLTRAGAIQLVELAILAALGAWLIWLARSEAVSRPALDALVGLYALIFLYHRTYDLVLLALPMTYAMAGAARSRGPTRLAYGTSLVLMASALNLRAEGLKDLSRRWAEIGWPVRALVLPAATWAILAALACLYVAARRARATDPDGAR